MSEDYPELSDSIGHRIVSHSGTDGCDRFTIETDRGTFVVVAEGDCCSNSWFENIDDAGVVGGLVTRVESSDPPSGFEMPEWSGPDYIACYFTTIMTSKGRLLLEMRNSSNGYYGGYYGVSYTPKED